ncbi:MAG TPA: SDR family oxidoreductase [Planctomycetota bacterium]|nr:SDR family oxidoreductase [Planctomycetota bacterium]
MDLGLTGSVAVVCAASRGLGRACATALAQEGCDLAICSRTPDAIEATAAQLRQATGRQVLAQVVDVTRPEDIAAFAAAVRARFGRCDILVNNSGGPPAGTFDQLDETAWSRACDLVLLNAVRTTKAFLPLIRAGRRGGRIITITSVSQREALANLILSNALRAAVAGWTKSLARELAPEAINVTCLAPGTIHTERIDELVAHNAKAQNTTHDRAAAAWQGRIPLGRFGRPEEFGAACAFLASSQASFITGSTIYVDGGQMATVA